MVYIRFVQNEAVKYGILTENRITVLTGSFLLPDSRPTGETVALDDVTLLSPVEPGKIVCVGVNYSEHAQEMQHELPEDPILFMKPASSVLPPQGTIIYPKLSRQVDYEGELAVVIGRSLHDAGPEEAMSGVFGYTCANDVTARDLQRQDGQWTRGKSFDTFCPLGPWIVTGIEPGELNIESILNGEVRQSSNTKYMITGVPHLVSYISQVMTLNPGDVILTGTPRGVGAMQRGDEIVVRIEQIGELRNYVGGKA